MAKLISTEEGIVCSECGTPLARHEAEGCNEAFETSDTQYGREVVVEDPEPVEPVVVDPPKVEKNFVAPKADDDNDSEKD